MSHHDKLSQLCAQAEQAIALALAASLDPVLRDLALVAVRPLRGAACLEVTVSAAEPDVDLDWLLGRLERARGYLRAELATAIHRKRTPELGFVVLPSE